MTELWVLLYLLVVGALNWAAYKRYNSRWSRRERARFVVGVLVVVAPAVVGAVLGPLDLLTVLVILGGFGVAGLITLGLDIDGETDAATILREAFGE